MELFLRMLKFATLGVATEVAFTAGWSLVNSFKNKEKIDLKLLGYSYVWMFPIYALIPLLGGTLLPHLAPFHFLLRWFLISLLILTIEYITGWILQKATGRCPWHYETGLHVHHLIRLDWIPFWMIFAAINEWLFYHY